VLQYLVPEQIDYNKESNCIHATVDWKKMDEAIIVKFKRRICGCGNELVQSGSYTYSILFHSQYHDSTSNFWQDACL
jgi:lipoate-protein ligase A